MKLAPMCRREQVFHPDASIKARDGISFNVAFPRVRRKQAPTPDNAPRGTTASHAKVASITCRTCFTQTYKLAFDTPGVWVIQSPRELAK